MDISTQHCAEDKAMVSSFPFRCVGRISYFLVELGMRVERSHLVLCLLDKERKPEHEEDDASDEDDQNGSYYGDYHWPQRWGILLTRGVIPSE